MVAVQAAGCAPMVRAWETGADHAEPWADAHTAAAGIRVPAAIGDALILRAVRDSGGFAIAIDEDDIFATRDRIAREDGLLLCPEGAATAAAWREALSRGLVSRDETAMLFNCATGLKYPLPAAGPAIDRHAPIDYAALTGAAA
jgi:threonine synthase